MEKKITYKQLQQVAKWLYNEESTENENSVREVLDELSKLYNIRYNHDHPVAEAAPRMRHAGLKIPTMAAIAGKEAAQEIMQIARTTKQAKPQEPVLLPFKMEEDKWKLDSVDVINAIAHVAYTSAMPLSSSKAQMILYTLYAKRLVSGKRLDIEHPQAWKHGPIFPRAYSKGRIADHDACRQSYNAISEHDPQTANDISSATLAILFTPSKDLREAHMGEGSPYAKTLKQNQNKLGIVIPDEDITKQYNRYATA